MSAPVNGLIEQALPIAQEFGLNTAKASNFAGTTIDTAGNISAASVVTGPTGSFATVNVTTAEVTATAGTGGTATMTSTVGAAAGGPASVNQHGWVKIKVAGVSCWVPEWQ